MSSKLDNTPDNLVAAMDANANDRISGAFAEFALMFASDVENKPPSTPLLAKRRLQQMSAGHAPQELFAVLDSPEIFEERHVPPFELLNGGEIECELDRDLIDKKLVLADMMEDLIRIWWAAAGFEDGEWHLLVHRKLDIWYTRECPFSDIETALRDSGVRPALEAYFAGVPCDDIAIDIEEVLNRVRWTSF